MYESEKELLKRLCKKSNQERQAALEDELDSMGIHYKNYSDMALVVPARSRKNIIVLCAHFDAVHGSCGYNDNGMALVTVLKMLPQIPDNMEIVFTNQEERGGLGAEYYLNHSEEQDICGVINLDVVGCFDQVYLDPMNFLPARSLVNCKQGNMPFSDAQVFAYRSIPSVCFSSGPSETSFREGIMKIFSTIHNNHNDNNFSFINFSMIQKVKAEVLNVFHMMNAA